MNILLISVTTAVITSGVNNISDDKMAIYGMLNDSCVSTQAAHEYMSSEDLHGGDRYYITQCKNTEVIKNLVSVN